MDLVSVIIPVYNCGDYIKETIDSVLNQTYSNFEVIIVDDCSTDNTSSVIKSFNSNKIKYFRLDINSGAAIARNNAIHYSTGTYLAFLDADDLWDKYKLEKQINFMIKNNYTCTSTLYQKIDSNSKKINWISKHFFKRDYELLLKRCPGNSTVIYNCSKLGKIYIPNVRKRNDYVMWLSLIKKSNYMYELDEVLSFYRIRNDSLSNKKSKLVKYQWHVYREIEKLSFFKSIYILSIYIVRGLLRIK